MNQAGLVLRPPAQRCQRRGRPPGQASSRLSRATPADAEGPRTAPWLSSRRPRRCILVMTRKALQRMTAQAPPNRLKSPAGATISSKRSR